MAETKVLVPRGCEHCGKPFMAKTVTTHFCSKECNNKNIEDRKKKIGEQKKMAAILKKKKEVYADIQSRPFITVSEASKLFRISEDTIRRMIRRDAIPGINLGIRLTRVDRVGLRIFSIL